MILEKHPGRRFCHALEEAQKQYRDLSKQFLPKLLSGFRPFGLFVLLGVAAYPFGDYFLGWNNPSCIIGDTVAAGVVGIIAYLVMNFFAERRSIGAYSHCGARCSRPAWAISACSIPPRPKASGSKPQP